MNDRFFWVDIKYACFGILSRDGIIIDTAPIAKWMKGKALKDIRVWLIKKNAKISES